MAAPATARVQEPRPNGVFGLTQQHVIVLVIQLLALAFSYGALKQSVDNLHERIVIIEGDVRAMRSAK